MTEGLQLGTIDITVAVAATLSGFDSDMDVFNFPYLLIQETGLSGIGQRDRQKIFDGMKEQGSEIYGTFDPRFSKHDQFKASY